MRNADRHILLKTNHSGGRQALESRVQLQAACPVRRGLVGKGAWMCHLASQLLYRSHGSEAGRVPRGTDLCHYTPPSSDQYITDQKVHLFEGLCKNLYWARTCYTSTGRVLRRSPDCSRRGCHYLSVHRRVGVAASCVQHAVTQYRLCKNPHTVRLRSCCDNELGPQPPLTTRSIVAGSR